jgi:hypothetical protein
LRDYYSRAQNLTAAANGLEAIFKPNRNLRDPLTFPLHAAAIICYARPFTHNEEVGALPARYARFATQRARDAHEDALHVRDKFVAHSDFAARKPLIVPTGWEIEPGYKSQAVGSQVMTELLPQPALAQLHQNCAEIVNNLHAAIEALERELYAGMELPPLPFRLKLDKGL